MCCSSQWGWLSLAVPKPVRCSRRRKRKASAWIWTQKLVGQEGMRGCSPGARIPYLFSGCGCGSFPYCTNLAVVENNLLICPIRHTDQCQKHRASLRSYPQITHCLQNSRSADKCALRSENIKPVWSSRGKTGWFMRGLSPRFVRQIIARLPLHMQNREKVTYLAECCAVKS